MIRIGVSLILMCCCCLHARKPSSQLKTSDSRKESVFSELKNVSVTLIICEAKINKQKTQTAIARQLNLFGGVQLDTPKNFGKGASVLQIMIGPIADSSSEKNAPVSYLPVTVISIQLLARSELMTNKALPIFGLAWERNSYVNRSSERMDKSVQHALEVLLQELQEEYEKAKITPNFFMNVL